MEMFVSALSAFKAIQACEDSKYFYFQKLVCLQGNVRRMTSNLQ